MNDDEDKNDKAERLNRLNEGNDGVSKADSRTPTLDCLQVYTVPVTIGADVSLLSALYYYYMSFFFLQSAVEELYEINKNSIENNTKDVNKELVDKMKELIELMKKNEGSKYFFLLRSLRHLNCVISL